MSRPVKFQAKSLICPQVSHGFFGRRADGGKLTETNQTMAGLVGVLPSHVIGVHQVHSARAMHVDAPWPGEAPQADALVSARPGLALRILTADCAPVLLHDRAAGVIGAAHAGWRGAMEGILEATVEAMTVLGASADNICAGIGPCIAQTSYEVGPEFYARITDDDSASAQFFVRGEADRWQFDLEGFCIRRLRGAGIGKIEALSKDTCSDAARLFSYRRATRANKPDGGRNISIIFLHHDEDRD
jgi:purine-nucleoside/S-methyl-5'-thioadenosine phosphorylase / adenosine deaminase